MVDAYTGEIRMFAGSFAPVGWHFADGSLLKISLYEQLFTLYGTVWGGDGVSTFGVPNLCGRLPMGQGQAPTPNSTLRTFGQYIGSDGVAITVANLPAHNHTFIATSAGGTTNLVSNTVTLGTPTGGYLFYVNPNATTTTTNLAPGAIANTPHYATSPTVHENRMPGIAVNYIICLNGIFPTRS
jgi:microcystin-dependent protein